MHTRSSPEPMRRAFWMLALVGACVPAKACPEAPPSASPSEAARGPDADAVRALVEKDLRDSAAAWNRGDLDTFVSSYSEDAIFVSPSGITRGRAEVLARYRKKYGTAPQTMGELTLEILDIRPASADDEVVGVAVVGHWRVRWAGREPPDDMAEGHTLLVYRPGPDGRWRIVHDGSM